jgi:hypothetical protein
MSVWVFQDPKQIEKHGEESAAWSVGWYDPEGKRRCKSCGPGSEGKRNAEKLRKKIDAELLTGTYQNHEQKSWQEFRKEYQARVIDGMGGRNRMETLHALDQFERVVSPKRIGAISSRTFAEFIAKRRREAAHRRAKGESDIFTEFGAIQAAAGVKPPAGRAHYAFHDLRRAFATLNAGRLTADALQLLMQHKDNQTTQRYINMARQVNPAAQNLFVPDLQPKKAGVS